MWPTLVRGRHVVRLAENESDLRRAQALRWRCFMGRPGPDDAPDGGQDGGQDGGLDEDAFDPICRHVLVEDRASGQLAACYRMLPLTGAEIARSYSARVYGLEALAGFAGPMIEIGRFCIRPGLRDPNIMLLAWGALARHVEAERVALLFGCSSFAGTDPAPHLDAFALLRAGHLAPARWRPAVKAPEVFAFADRLRDRPVDAARARAALPPLLRSYLRMGGWVSDHAVIDRQLDTLHVFTAVEVRGVTPSRRQLLRDGVRDALRSGSRSCAPGPG